MADTGGMDWAQRWHQRVIQHEYVPHEYAGLDPDQASRYARAALRAEATSVASCAPDSHRRNHTLNVAGFSLSQLVAAGLLEAQVVHDELTAAALSTGLGLVEIERTLASSFKAGLDQPRAVELDAPVELSVVELNGHARSAGPTAEPAGSAEPVTADEQAVLEAVRERLPALDWRELWETESDDEWIVEPLLPARRLVALYSAPKVGKSLLMLELAVAISLGKSVLGVPVPSAHRVLYVDFENDPRGDIRDRLQSMGYTPADLDGLVYLSFPRLAKLDTLAGGLDLLAAVQAYACTVVVIDTISRAVAGEENDNDTWLSFYRSTGMALKAAGVACVRLDHSGKDVDRGMRGGSAKYSDVDAVWQLAEVTTDVLYRLECTDARMPVPDKRLMLRRETGPLRHLVQDDQRGLAENEKVNAIIRLLDDARLPNTAGRRGAEPIVRASSVKAGNRIIDAACKARQTRLGG